MTEENKEVILIADDERGIVSNIKKILEVASKTWKIDHEIICAYSAEEAAKAIEERNVFLAILDVSMGKPRTFKNEMDNSVDSVPIIEDDISGYEIAIEAMLKNPQIHIILMSGGNVPNSFDYIQKPFKYSEMIGKVMEAVYQNQK